MPFGLGWLVDVKEFFVSSPGAMPVAVFALHYLYRYLKRKCIECIENQNNNQQ